MEEKLNRGPAYSQIISGLSINVEYLRDDKSENTQVSILPFFFYLSEKWNIIPYKLYLYFFVMQMRT